MVHEILEAVDSERVKAKKLEILKTYGDDSFKMTMIWNFDESVVSMLPEGNVPYQPVESDVQASVDKGLPQRSTIRNTARQFYRFVKGGDDAMNKIKRESLFINILETLPPPEAEILVLVKDKALNTKYNITKELVAERRLSRNYLGEQILMIKVLHEKCDPKLAESKKLHTRHILLSMLIRRMEKIKSSMI